MTAIDAALPRLGRAVARRLTLALLALGLLASAGQAQVPATEPEAADADAASSAAAESAGVGPAAEALAAVAPRLFPDAGADADDAPPLVPAEFSLAGPAHDHGDTALAAGPALSGGRADPGPAGGARLVAPSWLVLHAAMVRSPAVRAPRADRAPLVDSRGHAWTLAGHTSRRSSDGAVDGQSVTVGGGLGRDPGRLFAGRARLSLEAGYDQYQDRVSPSGSSQGAYAFLRLAFPAF